MGGADVHSSKLGVSHFKVENEEEGLLLIRKLLTYLPSYNLEEPPVTECLDPIDRMDDSLNDIIPENPNEPYDVREIIDKMVDYGEFLEIHRHSTTLYAVADKQGRKEDRDDTATLRFKA